MDRQQWIELLRKTEELYAIHEAGASDASKCREFNSKASLFLEMLEEMGEGQLADRVMDILSGCSPKDFSPCDRRQMTKGSLERLKERIKESRDDSEEGHQ
jgi:hypothetical protein